MTPLPPKQGLKQVLRREFAQNVGVMTPLPPKQGLKRKLRWLDFDRTLSYDTTSTKTRIETGLPEKSR